MKKMMVSVMAIAMLASMGLGSFADYAPAAHTHNFNGCRKIYLRGLLHGNRRNPYRYLG